MTDTPIDTAIVEADPDDAVAVVTDGRVVSSTMERLSLPPGAVEGIRDQAITLIEEVVRAYEAHVAHGEVGFGGSGRAASDERLGDECPTGLLYGRIQSGKTNAMILSTALAIDNGFRVIVVLTSDNTALVEQTASRFRVLDEGPLVYASTSEQQWTDDRENIARHLARHGVVFVCSKNRARMSSLIAALRAAGAADYPALIFDDEADQATPDTTTASRASGRAGAPAHGSTTYRLAVQNDAASEEGESIRETLRHNVFVQVTATPYALLLQNIDSPLRPTFTRLLEPGEGYTGGAAFFSPDQVENEQPPLAFVDANETTNVRATDTVAPQGLARAIAFFLLGSTTLRLRRGRPEPEGYKFLCHTSPRQDDHNRFAAVIRNHADRLFDELTGQLRPQHRATFEWAYANLQRSGDVPDLDRLLEELGRRIQHRRILVVNSAANSAEFGSAYNFLVGGNILGRGLTIDNLLVTYYLRMPRTTQMDTMLQHARMFGYRSGIMSVTRVFLPRVLAARFARISEAEHALRALLDEQPASTGVPVQVVGNLRPTRANVLDPNAIGGIRAGQQVYPVVPAHSPEDVGTTSERIEEALRRILGGSWQERIGGPVACSVEDVVSLVRTVRSGDPDGSDWDSELLSNVLHSVGVRYGGRAHVYVREFRTEREILLQGAISGAEQRLARTLGGPVLFLLRERGDHAPWSGIPFWYPTLVFPRDMPNQVFNVT